MPEASRDHFIQNVEMLGIGRDEGIADETNNEDRDSRTRLDKPKSRQAATCNSEPGYPERKAVCSRRILIDDVLAHSWPSLAQPPDTVA